RSSALERSIAPGTGSPASSEYARASSGRDRMVETDELKQAQTRIHKPVGISSRAWIGLAALVILLSLAGYGLYRTRARTETKPSVPFERVEVTKLTTNGNALMGALSPDGKYVAYVTGESGKQSLWLRQVDINSNSLRIAGREGRYLGLAFSPDGNYVYFGYAESASNDATQVYRLPVLGSDANATRFDLQAGLPGLSHDRKRIAFIRYDRAGETDSLIVSNVDGSDEKVVGTRKWPNHFGWDPLVRPEWTADDRVLMLPLVRSDPSYTGDTS